VKAKDAFIADLPTPVEARRRFPLLFHLVPSASLSGRFRSAVKAKDAFIADLPTPVEARRRFPLLFRYMNT
ncbi:hypothetical protein, partial [Sporosarcina obsidiansis]|uniref:hypothetical protein n=1 Tax=Sporosarcina obsidiansis TaxID=2660748 RepID=UPI001E583845